MRCYRHRDVEAVGLCVYCHRAVCERCSHYDGFRLYCNDHDEKTYSLNFTKHYMMAIDLAREAGVKGVKTSELIKELEKQLAKS